MRIGKAEWGEDRPSCLSSKKVSYSLFIICLLLNLLQKHIGHKNHTRWVRFHVRCLLCTSKPMGHSTPPLTHSKHKMEGSHCQYPALLSFSSGGGLFPTTPPLPPSKHETEGQHPARLSISSGRGLFPTTSHSNHKTEVH